jgi:hypothetical protein
MKEGSDSPKTQKSASKFRIAVILTVISVAMAVALMILLSKMGASDREVFYHYICKIEEVSNYKMSQEQIYELHDFCKGAIFGNEDFRVSSGELKLDKILQKRNIDMEFVSYPSVWPVTAEDHRAKLEQIKKEFMEKSPTKISANSEWAFIFHRRDNAFSDGICKWWNLIPAPPLKMWEKTEFVIQDCFRTKSLLWRKLLRTVHIHFYWFISKINDIKNNLYRK